MKKIFSVLWLLVCTLMVANAASYGIIVNGKRYFAGTKNPSPGDPSFEEYMALGVPLKSGDVLALYDADNKASWAVTLDKASTTGINKSGDQYSCSKAGCYDFYIKLKYQQDQLYVGPGAAGCTDWGKDIGDDPTPPDPDCQDGPYGLEINGTDIVNAPMFGEPDAQGRVQYKAACVELKANDIIKLANLSCDARWMADVDPYGAYQNFSGGSSTGSLTCKVDGKYDFYIKLSADQGDLVYIGIGEDCDSPTPPTPCPDERPNFASSVPSQCPDVILQSFYYDSYQNKGYGDTKWKTLQKQAAEIGSYFDLVWLPPSAKSEGGTGYHPRQYSNQNSDWGTRVDLVKLIDMFHEAGARVIADVVVNHLGCKSTWCDFFEQDFGCYGKFQPSTNWICKSDEINFDQEAGECYKMATGLDDDGYNGEGNYASARDLAHQDASVRNMCKAYTRWLKNDVGYDGYRYDYCKGFHMSHVNDYNSAAKNYFSIIEFWSGTDDIWGRIQDANYNTLAFDFQTKYQAISDYGGKAGMCTGNYSGCKGSGLLGAGHSKYAVTYVDSHDTFQRDDNEFGGKGNSMKTVAMRNRVKQANAFILSMPGVPCVFYPHWSYFKKDIKDMINARHLAGVHSESAVSEETAEAGGYTCKVQGKNGYLVLQLGNKVTNSYSGYIKKASGNGYAMWIKLNNDVAPTVMVNPGTSIFRDKEEGLTITLEAIGGCTTSGTTDCTIYYTTDGTEPTTASKSFSGKGTLTVKEDLTTLKVMGVCGKAQSEVKTYTYTYKAPQTTPIVLRFAKPDTWDAVYFFVCDTAWNPYNGSWPGKEVTIGTDGWYTFTCPAELKAVNFIFNNNKGGEQSSDLYTEDDVCYVWGGSDAIEDPTCAGAKVTFSLVISPKSTVFKDNVKGFDVTATAVGAAGDATIYYTTDGSTPTEASQSVKNVLKLNLKTTTTLKAFAVANGEKTDVQTEVYTYKQPQATPIKVTFNNLGNWDKVGLYAWGVDDAQTKLVGEWPGIELQKGSDGLYTYQFNDSIKEANLIFNEFVDGGMQTQDLYTDEDYCWEWNGKDAQPCTSTGLEGLTFPTEMPYRKFIKDDHLYITYKGVTYDIMGNKLH